MAKKAQLHCNLDLDTDMTDLRDALRLGPDNTGRITGRITAIHDYDNPELNISLGYAGGDLEGLKINKAMLDCTITDRQATIKTLHAAYASGLIDFTGIVDLRKAFPQGYFEGIKEEDAITYDLSIIGTSLLISDLPGMPKGLKGKLSPKIGLKGTGVSADSVRLDAQIYRTWPGCLSRFVHERRRALPGRQGILQEGYARYPQPHCPDPEHISRL